MRETATMKFVSIHVLDTTVVLTMAVVSLAEIRQKMLNASPKKKTIQQSITEASKPVAKVEEKRSVPSTLVKEVAKPVEAVVEPKLVDATSKTDAESVEEASDKENTSAAANKKVHTEDKPALKDSPTKPKPSSPSKINAASTYKKQQTLPFFFKQPTSTSPLKRKREEDGVDDEVQGKSKQLKTHA
jgi:Na+-transporting NADH:ubiquinone oxidoreductase subunit NqrC